MIVNSDIPKISRYFDVSSAYVPNQFDVQIYKLSNGNVLATTYQENAPASGDPNAEGYNPLYLINGEPWVVEDISLPQIRFKQSDDIYVDKNTLLRPNYILSVNTTGEVKITVREKSNLAIYRSLIRCQTEMFNDKYEYSGANIFGNDYFLQITCKSQRFDSKVLTSSTYNSVASDNIIRFDRVILSNISDPTFSYKETGFMKYEIIFEVSSMAESYYKLVGKSSAKATIGNPSSSIGSSSLVNSSSGKSVSTTTPSDRASNNLPVSNPVSAAIQNLVANQLILPTVSMAAKNAGRNVATGVNKAVSSYNPSVGSIDLGLNVNSLSQSAINNTVNTGVNNQTGLAKIVLGNQNGN